MSLEQWAMRHGVGIRALSELREMLVAGYEQPIGQIAGLGEAAVQSRVRLAASELGWRLFRNNNGAAKLSDGSFVRWGLANDSAQLNARLKSSDLIGIRPRLIGPSDIGSTIGQFVSIEVKHAGWHYTGTEREVAQWNWLGLVTSLGGYAQFVTSADQLGYGS